MLCSTGQVQGTGEICNKSLQSKLHFRPIKIQNQEEKQIIRNLVTVANKPINKNKEAFPIETNKWHHKSMSENDVSFYAYLYLFSLQRSSFRFFPDTVQIVPCNGR